MSRYSSTRDGRGDRDRYGKDRDTGRYSSRRSPSPKRGRDRYGDRDEKRDDYRSGGRRDNRRGSLDRRDRGGRGGARSDIEFIKTCYKGFTTLYETWRKENEDLKIRDPGEALDIRLEPRGSSVSDYLEAFYKNVNTMESTLASISADRNSAFRALARGSRGGRSRGEDDEWKRKYERLEDKYNDLKRDAGRGRSPSRRGGSRSPAGRRREDSRGRRNSRSPGRGDRRGDRDRRDGDRDRRGDSRRSERDRDDRKRGSRSPPRRDRYGDRDRDRRAGDRDGGRSTRDRDSRSRYRE